MTCPLEYNLSVTGDCNNTFSGAVTIDIFGTAPDYTVSGASGNSPLGPGVTSFTETNLSAGTYVYSISDSCLPVNNTIYVNVNISSGTCVSITGIENTICGLDNGSITAQTTNLYNVAIFDLYGTSGYVKTETNVSNTVVFTNLSADTYYVIGNDGGGCTGKSESCIIKSSTTLDYGFYVINDTPCNSTPTSGLGKIYITGLTGVAPYYYYWSNGETTSSISGLTAGTYSVTVNDSSGCSQEKSIYVGKVDSPGVGAVYVTQPSCFVADGQVQIVVTGGTAPYYYSGSTGEVAISLSNTYTFTNVPAGYFTISVTDAGLCNFTTSTILVTPSSFGIFNISTQNSTCNNLDGLISIQLVGGAPPYTYTITDSSGNTQSVNTPSLTFSFGSLPSDTYTITITDSNLICTYSDTVTVSNTVQFILTGITTGTTCNQSNGSIELGVSGGSGNYRYQITGQPFIDLGLSSYTFTNLSSGSYVGTVTDLSNFCVQTINLNVASSTSVNFSLFSINPLTGNDGEIYAFISSGTPPFTLTWSDNVNGQTDLHVTGLTAGTYSLTVTDSSGCTQTRYTSLNGYNKYSTGQTFNVCNSNFADAGLLQKGPKQMLIEGFYDLTSGDTNCILNQAIFTVETILSGETKTESFYTGYTLNDYPSDTLWANTVESLLETYGEVGDVIIDIVNNTIQIISNCNPDLLLMDVEAIVNLKIQYDISCETCLGPIELDTFTLNCIINFTFDLQFDYSVTGGSGNYEIQVFSGNQWLSLYSFVGVNDGNNVSVGPVFLDLSYFTQAGNYDLRLYDINYGIHGSTINYPIVGCAP